MYPPLNSGDQLKTIKYIAPNCYIPNSLQIMRWKVAAIIHCIKCMYFCYISVHKIIM